MIYQNKNQMSDTNFSRGGDDLLITSPIHQLEDRRHRRHQAAWAGLALLMIGSFVALGQNGLLLTASILPTKQAPAFDGTVYPIEKVPNWVKLQSAEYKYSYEQIPASKMLNTPFYSADALARTVDTLKWGNAADDAVRNQKITYPVPYMGSYRLNGLENDGSHLAVDIKVPMNTPVRSIANGVVVKLANQTNGFGKHVVIVHQNVPSLEDPNTKTTYYSSYSHLGSVIINEGDIVLRGQNIGLSGQTGFATTPHIHFQIDRINAPWHPFWGFTYQEQVAAGLDFVGAINASLGKDKAYENTINPMTFVQRNLTTTPISTGSQTSVPNSTPAPTPTPVVTPAVADPVVAVPTPVTPTPTVISFAFNQKASYQLGEDIKMTLVAKDQNGNSVNALDESALLLLSGDVGNLSKADVTTGDLSDGQFVFRLQNPRVGQGQVTVMYKGVQTKSTSFDVINPTPTPQPVATKADLNRTKLFADVAGDEGFYDAIKYVKDKGVFGGYNDGTFKPDQVISRVEVLKVALKSSNRQILPTKGMLSYTDLDPNAWYIPYIATAQQNGITQGYIGGYFRPAQNVTRAEFLKILLLSSPVSLNPTVNNAPYSDVNTTDWSAVFAQFAKEKNLLPSTAHGFKANEEITRGEVAEIIYRLLVILNTGSNTYTAGLANS